MLQAMKLSTISNSYKMSDTIATVRVPDMHDNTQVAQAIQLCKYTSCSLKHCMPGHIAAAEHN